MEELVVGQDVCVRMGVRTNWGWNDTHSFNLPAAVKQVKGGKYYVKIDNVIPAPKPVEKHRGRIVCFSVKTGRVVKGGDLEVGQLVPKAFNEEMAEELQTAIRQYELMSLRSYVLSTESERTINQELTVDELQQIANVIHAGRARAQEKKEKANG